MDAAFFSSLGCADEAELRQFIRHDLDAQLGDAMQKALRGQIMKYLIDNTPMELPPDLSQRQVERAVMRRMVETYWEGVPQDQIAKEMDKLRAEAAEHAIHDLKFFFIAEKIAEDNKVEVTDEEFNGAIAQIARRRRQRFDRTRDELAKDNGLDALYMQLRDRKIVDQLLEKAKIEETTGPENSEKNG
jgi:trigger factor